MLEQKKISVKGKPIFIYRIILQKNSLIILKGSKGYIMCGYLNLCVARKCCDAAVKITGVSSIEESLRARVHSCTLPASKLGIKKGMPVLKVLSIIA
mgnify:CR=1 FL=1